jgi:hypothetical protein
MDRVRKLRWLPAALVAVALAATLTLTACGADEKKESGVEGEFIRVGEDVDLQVQLTRLVNPQQRPDDAFVRGQPPLPAGEAFLGVFMKIENDGDKPYTPPRDMKVVDTQGNEYLPLDTVQSSFGLDFGTAIPAGDVVPPPGSPASFSPTSGALVLFRITEESATDNLPLVLEIPVEGQKEPARITLDV